MEGTGGFHCAVALLDGLTLPAAWCSMGRKVGLASPTQLAAADGPVTLQCAKTGDLVSLTSAARGPSAAQGAGLMPGKLSFARCQQRGWSSLELLTS